MSGAVPRPDAPGLSDYVRLARRSGIGRAWSYFTEAHVFDLLRGTDTAHWRPSTAPAAGASALEQGFRYEACYTSELRRCLALTAAIAPPAATDFVDLGCGKGKALLMAAKSGFHSVTGVEYDPDLVRIARDNLARRGLAGRVACEDATTFDGYGPRCLVFLFNPFGEAALRQVIAQLRALTTDCVVIYSNPTQAHLFADWETVAATHGGHSSRTSRIFRLSRSPG